MNKENIEKEDDIYLSAFIHKLKKQKMTPSVREDPTEGQEYDKAQYIETLDNFYEQGIEVLDGLNIQGTKTLEKLDKQDIEVVDELCVQGTEALGTKDVGATETLGDMNIPGNPW